MTTAWNALWAVAEAFQPEAGGPRGASRRRGISDWARVLRLANEHYLAPAMYVALTRSHALADLETEVREYLALLHQLNVERNDAMKEQGLELVGALNRAGIMPMLLKGAIALFSDLYPDHGARMLRDLDVLVPADAAHDAVRSLQAAGYEPKVLYEAGHNAIGDFGRANDPGAVDLHVEIIDSPYLLPARDVWRRGRETSVGDVRFMLPSPQDMVMHNILHAQVHYLGNYYRGILELRQLYEFATLAQRYSGEINWQLCSEQLAVHELSTPLESYALAASRLFGIPWMLPHPVSRAARMHCNRALLQAAIPALGALVLPIANIRAAFATHRMRALHAAEGPLPVQQVRHAVQFVRKKSGRGVFGKLFRAH